MKEEWLFPGAIVPVDVETTSALVAEIKRLIDVVGGMALAQQEPVAWQQCPWTGLTVDEIITLEQKHMRHEDLSRSIEAKLRERNE
jgi:hypothetical protein